MDVHDSALGFIFTTLPWWIAAPLLQLGVLAFGMALDETYVNRTTIVTGAIAVQIHGLVAGDVGLLVSLYGDIGLVVGAYGLYAYVVDAYVANWFRVLAYFVYSPLSAFLVILTAGPTLFGLEVLFVPALVAAAYANLQLMAHLAPTNPYYFGPATPAEFDAAVEGADENSVSETEDQSEGSRTEAADRAADDSIGDSFDEPDVAAGDGSDAGRPGADPAAASDSSERGILPGFMRRL